MPQQTLISRALKGLALSLCGFGLVSCSAKTENIEWSAASGRPLPKALTTAEFAKTDKTAAAAGQRVSQSLQRQGDFLVQGGYLKQIYDNEGNLTRVIGRQVALDPALVSQNFSELQAKTDQVLAAGRIRSVELRDAQEILKTKWLLQPFADGSAEAQLKVDFVSQDHSRAIEVRLNPHGQIVGRRVLSQHLDAGVARVFPFGPLQSTLTDKPLEELIGDGRLHSEKLTVTSESTEQAFSPNLVFRYEPGDLRFDQVQVYYQIDRFLKHYRNQHQLDIPFALKAKIHVGFPAKKNVAFYYDGQIRLGSGDGIDYEHMPRDPSVVMHEAAHAITEAFADLEFEGDAGSINEGFADFFAANVLNTPKMAEASYLKGPYKRNINNESTTADLTGARYQDSLVVSGTLWELRKEIGQKPSADFALKTLALLTPHARISDLKKAFATVLEESNLEEPKAIDQKGKIVQVLSNRGWL